MAQQVKCLLLAWTETIPAFVYSRPSAGGYSDRQILRVLCLISIVKLAHFHFSEFKTLPLSSLKTASKSEVEGDRVNRSVSTSELQPCNGAITHTGMHSIAHSRSERRRPLTAGAWTAFYGKTAQLREQQMTEGARTERTINASLLCGPQSQPCMKAYPS